MHVKIIGTGSYLPKTVVTNEELSYKAPINPDWVKENLGIEQRHIVNPALEKTSDLAEKAARKALGEAGIGSEEVNLLIVATSTPDKMSPSTACIVQKKLLAFNTVAFDVNAVCSGFVFALSIAANMLEAGQYKTALVIGADTFSTITNWKHKYCTFFGDGAGAVVLQAISKEKHILGTMLGSDGTGENFFSTPHGGTFHIEPKELYDFGCSVLPMAVDVALERAGLKVEDIDHVVPHQASKKMLLKLCELMGVPTEKLRTNMDKVSNTAAGTVPILLDELNRSGQFKEGDHLLMVVMGSGMTYGAMVYEW